MKSGIFFMIFFINILFGLYFRNPIAFAFSIIALVISVLFSCRDRVVSDKKNEDVKETLAKNK